MSDGLLTSAGEAGPTAARATGTPASTTARTSGRSGARPTRTSVQAEAFLDAVEAGDRDGVLSTYRDALGTDRLTRAVVAATGPPGLRPPASTRPRVTRSGPARRLRLRLRASAPRARPGGRGLPGLDVHAGPRVEVRFERLLAGPVRLRDVDEVDPDAVPDGRPATHPVDQDVGRLEVLGDVGVAGLPALEAGHRLVLELRPGDLDDRDRRLAPAGRGRPRAGPFGRQARVRVAGRDRGRPLGGDLRRRAATLAATRARIRSGAVRALDGWTRGGSPACLA